MGGIWQKEVGKKNIRKYALDILNLYKSEEKMSKQAKTLSNKFAKKQKHLPMLIKK